ncbi:hypothetical protein BDF14DRAFT_1729888 [Spinellus fusiger]|nr:hypothetical protein BDF14DRAFT_1729888 [Spinellus fusiger]
MDVTLHYLPVLTAYVPTPVQKCISKQEDVEVFVQSKAFSRLMTFIDVLNTSVVSTPNSSPCHVSAQTQHVLRVLETVEEWMALFPPLENPQRFGNKAFRGWLSHVEQYGGALMSSALPSSLSAAVPELLAYFVTSFGNETRIDYGSGHELSFCAWLCGLTLLGVFKAEDHTALVLRVFVKYLEVVRKLQRTYSLEPAGSHGVWGLDDHQFLPYVWGSAQLIDHPRLKPKHCMAPDVVATLSDEYMYLRCLQYIQEVKTGPFHEHSPMLYDISAVVSWNKVNSGMAKMYVAEVLKKVPVVQHFCFGYLLPMDKQTTDDDVKGHPPTDNK